VPATPLHLCLFHEESRSLPHCAQQRHKTNNRTHTHKKKTQNPTPRVALPIVGTFSAERRRWVQKSYFCRWSRWVSKREIRLGSDIRSGKNGVDAVTKRVKMVEKTIRRTSVSSGTTSEKPIYIPRLPRGMYEP
jgi:hypothetical protein